MSTDRPAAASAALHKSDAPTSGEVGAGRGLLYITAAKVWFMVGAGIVSFALPFILGSRERYGEWSNILSWVSVLNNLLITATVQTVSRFASRGAQYVEGAKRAALRLQLLVGGLLALGFFAASPLIARAEADPGMTRGLQLTSGVVLAYAFYAVFVGAANGARQFHKQAGLDMSFTTLRTILVCGEALVFHSVLASVGGFVAAAVTVLLLSIVVVGLKPAEEPASPSELFRFMLPVGLYLLVLNCLMFVDGWLLKPLAAQYAVLANIPNPAAYANAQLGIYGVVQNVARLPYQAILSVTFVIFPLVSRATFDQDHERTRGYIDKSIRLPLLVVTAMAVAVAARPSGVLGLFPKGEYLAGGTALAVLGFGYVAFSLMSIAGTIINGAGRTRPTTVIGAVTVALDGALTFGALKWALATGRDPLAWAAIGTTVAMCIGLAMSLGYLQRRFGASMRMSTFLRTAVAAAVGIAAGRFVPLHGKLGGLIACAVGGLGFVAVIVGSGELRPAELKAMLRRGKG
jgi:stage V sporulation protein B